MPTLALNSSSMLNMAVLITVLLILNTCPGNAKQSTNSTYGKPPPNDTLGTVDTSKYESKPLTAIRLESGKTYDFKWRTLDGSNIKLDGVFRCWNADRVTLLNVIVTGSPRYAFLARNCTNATIKNFRMVDMPKTYAGIRFDKDGGTANGLTLFNITADSVGGHAVKVWNANGFKIDQITANNTPSGCGLLLSNCQNGAVGTVTGTGNCPKAGYATLRIANSCGPGITVKKVVSRNSGRGVFILVSYGAVIDYVDIAGASSEGIYVQAGTHTTVKAGMIRGHPNCRNRGGPGNKINADCGGSILH